MVGQVYQSPATFRFWARSNYTRNIEIFKYVYNCIEISVRSDQNSRYYFFQNYIKKYLTNVKTNLNFSLFLYLNQKYNYRLNKFFSRNKWKQFAIVQIKEEMNVYIDGALQIDIYKLKIITICEKNNNAIEKNNFRIIDANKSQNNVNYEPMRGEITKVYLLNASQTEEDILRSYYTCEVPDKLLNIVFDWRRVLIDDYLKEFKRKVSSFCNGCTYPDISRHSAINFEGNKNGDTRWYKCKEGFEMIGYSSSVCLIDGNWSQKMPMCKGSSLKLLCYFYLNF